MKKYIVSFLAMQIILLAASFNAFAVDDEVRVMVDESIVEFDQPPIIEDGRTLVPIRAVAEKIGATVEWDGSRGKVNITKGDIELSLRIGDNGMNVTEERGMYTEFLDVGPKIYGGRTLMPIRAIAEKLGCEVQWDEKNKTVKIEYETITRVKGLENTQLEGRRWAAISSVQQFPYKDEGLAYAYIKEKNLEIILPNNRLSLDMKYPILGDVISDSEGNIYVVWGRMNETDDAKVETVFISKYSSEGQHIKTTGFVGESSPWGDSDGAKTKVPFYAGNSVSAIENGILINYHGKKRYDGHQSDGAIAVRTSDMSAYELPNNTFMSHSFDQSIIYSELTSSFLFASQGDAYARGFRINDVNGKCGDENEVIFHFYLESNASYNMSIVNETFAHMGGMVETSKGIAFVGSSVKSIGEEAKTESKNLFIQILNPLEKNISPSKFIGGEERKGATSFDINDRNNSPLEEVTDYGVHWLTDYNDYNAISPQVVEADDNIVILWAANDDTFYTVLSAEGNVITPTNSLNGPSLNTHERPVYYDGDIHWVSVKDGRLRKNVISLDM